MGIAAVILGIVLGIFCLSLLLLLIVRYFVSKNRREQKDVDDYHQFTSSSVASGYGAYMRGAGSSIGTSSESLFSKESTFPQAPPTHRQQSQHHSCAHRPRMRWAAATTVTRCTQVTAVNHRTEPTFSIDPGIGGFDRLIQVIGRSVYAYLCRCMTSTINTKQLKSFDTFALTNFSTHTSLLSLSCLLIKVHVCTVHYICVRGMKYL